MQSSTPDFRKMFGMMGGFRQAIRNRRQAARKVARTKNGGLQARQQCFICGTEWDFANVAAGPKLATQCNECMDKLIQGQCCFKFKDGFAFQKLPKEHEWAGQIYDLCITQAEFKLLKEKRGK